MARRRKGRAVDGWLVVDKPEGVTSTAVVGRARWALEARKAGHAGTLDPLASGLLAIAFGEATKTVALAQEGRKTYRFTVRWGASTTTDDREGEVTTTSAHRPSDEEIRSALPAFHGEIMQRPPVFSAIKVDGARAYDLARAGEAPDLTARPIMMHALALIERPDVDHAIFEMTCGKGGYVRSIGRDLGEALGTPAHVTALRRLRSGGFDLSGAIGWEALEALRERPDRDDVLSPVTAALGDAALVEIGAEAARRLYHGDVAAAPGAEQTICAVHAGAPVALLSPDDQGMRILRVFTPPGG